MCAVLIGRKAGRRSLGRLRLGIGSQLPRFMYGNKGQWVKVQIVGAAFWLWLGACVAIFIAAVFGGFGPPIIATLLGIGAIGFVLTFIWRSRALQEAERLQVERDTARLAELKLQLQTGLPIEIQGSSGIGLFLLLAAGTVASCYFAWIDPGIGTALLSVVLVLLALLMFAAALPAIGKPVLIIRADSLETPSYGMFKWSEIDGLHLRTITHKGATVNHFLDLRIPLLQSRREQFHWVARLVHGRFALIQQQRTLQIRLAATSERAEVIHHLCKDAWTARTGKSHIWHAGMSEADLQSLRQGREPIAALEHVGEMIKTDPALAMRMLDELKKENPSSHAQICLDAATDDRAGLQQIPDPNEQMEQLRRLLQRNRESRQRLNELTEARYKTHPVTWAVTIALVIVAIVVVAQWVMAH